MSVLALIRSTFGVDSDYYTEVQRCLHKCFVYDHFLVIYSSLQSALDALRNGYLFDSRQLLEADVAADYLEQASQLHVAGYKDAAAVISGSVLERHLRNMCNARGISLFKPSGKPKTINDLNDELGKSAVLNTLKRKQITSWADIRNNAAHGNYDKYLATDVEAMIRDVGVFCADFS